MNYGELQARIDALNDHLLNTNIRISNLENTIHELAKLLAQKPASKSNTCKANGRRNAKK